MSALTPIDWIIIVAYFGIILGIAWKVMREKQRTPSHYCLRLLAREPEPATRESIRERVRASIERRRGYNNGNACPLVFGEADLLPSIVVDRYGDNLVLQTLSAGADAIKSELIDSLRDLVRPRSILERNDVRARGLEGLPEVRGILWGEMPERVEIVEGGVRFLVDLSGGQKTGFFLDQSDNRIAARFHAGGRALDCFTNTGGFALHFAQRAEAAAGNRSGTGSPAPATSAGPPAGGPFAAPAPRSPRAMELGTLAIQLLNSVQYGLLLSDRERPHADLRHHGDHQLAHGSFYMVGAYLAWSPAERLGSLWLAIPADIAHSVAIGALLEWLMISRLYRRDHLYQVLLTYGLILVFEELRSIIWGDDVHGVAVPAALSAAIPLTETLSYPVYRLWISGVWILLPLGMYWPIARTRIGMTIRAGASSREMVVDQKGHDRNF